ncbi:transposase [bacterium]|nr:transposase [bacterium]MBU1957434.1 transposase [bacterium]
MNYRRIYLHNYSYYLTLVTQGREPLLVENIELLRDAFRRSKQKYIYSIHAIVVLPDHLHMIITPKIATDYSKIIRHIKRSFVYGLHECIKTEAKSKISHAKYNRGHSGIWQERFYEHTIRNEKDWLEKMEYIKNNPIKHKLVNNLEDWQYTSFK